MLSIQYFRRFGTVHHLTSMCGQNDSPVIKSASKHLNFEGISNSYHSNNVSVPCLFYYEKSKVAVNDTIILIKKSTFFWWAELKFDEWNPTQIQFGEIPLRCLARIVFFCFWFLCVWSGFSYFMLDWMHPLVSNNISN